MLNRWDPFTEIARLQDQMFRPGTPAVERATFAPPVDVHEEKEAILLKAELPGVKPEDVKVTVENDVLTLAGERKLESKEEREGYQRIERTFGTFARSFALPKTVDGEKVEASLDAGVLTVRIPKKSAPEPRRIAVKSGSPGPTKPAGQA